MRRRIRLTGRKQLSKANVNVKVAEVGNRRLVTLTVGNQSEYAGFPGDSRLLVRLAENKLVELLEFGTLDQPRVTAELRNPMFVAPSCQLRIVATDGQRKGLLLGSTDTWTLRADGDDAAQKGILLFKPAPIAPRVWKLDIRENDYPVVYLDKRIPQAGTWAKTDPTFVGGVLPAIVSQVFMDIMEQDEEPDIPWMKDWMIWADTLMPGQKLPFGQAMPERSMWVEGLIDSFCSRHHISDRLVRSLLGDGDGA